MSTSESRSRGHGREEIRRCQAFEVGDRLYKAEQWRDLRSFAVVERTRTVGGRTTVDHRHYISSLAPEADKIAHAVRSHREVENRLHWCLDVQFGNDYARGRSGHVAQNLSLVRHIALNLLRLSTSRKASIKTSDCWPPPRTSIAPSCLASKSRKRTMTNVMRVAARALRSVPR